MDRACAEAVLRGADVFAPGVVGLSADVAVGSRVSVVCTDPAILADLSRGTKLSREAVGGGTAGWIHVGNGEAGLSRRQLFPSNTHCDQQPKTKQIDQQKERGGGSDGGSGGASSSATAATQLRGIAVRMTERRYESPSLNGVLPQWLFLQNLPSMLVSHVLAPRPGDRVLDLCAAPGGKTTHCAALMDAGISVSGGGTDGGSGGKRGGKGGGASSGAVGQGIVVAIDRSKSRLAEVGKLAERLGLSERIALVAMDGTRAHELLAAKGHAGKFDRILLDPPCSALGLRPRLSVMATPADLIGCAEYQKRFVHAAVELLAPGGVLVYSTCTINPQENEEIIAHALKTHPRLRLDPPEDPRFVLGERGWPGCGLSEADCQLVQRFDPSAPSGDGSIGFFLARLRST